MGNSEDNIREAKRLAHVLMQGYKAEVESGKGGAALRLMFSQASRAERDLKAGKSLIPEVDRVFASYLPDIDLLAAERDIVFKDEETQKREQLIREADSGNANAQAELAMAYISGLYGIDRDAHKGIEYRIKAAERGHKLAIFHLSYDVGDAESNVKAGPDAKFIFGCAADDDELTQKLIDYKERVQQLVEQHGVDLDSTEGDPECEWQYIPDSLGPE